jgi:hypothetical protein
VLSFAILVRSSVKHKHVCLFGTRDVCSRRLQFATVYIICPFSSDPEAFTCGCLLFWDPTLLVCRQSVGVRVQIILQSLSREMLQRELFGIDFFGY